MDTGELIIAARGALFGGSYPAGNTHQAMHEMLTCWDDVPSLEVVDDAGFTADSLRVRFGYAYEANLAQLVLMDLARTPV